MDLQLIFRIIENPVVDMFIGGIFGWICTRYYYKKTSEELLGESKKTIEKLDSILRTLAENGIGTLQEDSKGNISDFVINLESAKINMTSDNIKISTNPPSKTS